MPSGMKSPDHAPNLPTSQELSVTYNTIGVYTWRSIIEQFVTLTFLTSCGPLFQVGKNDVNENSLVVRLHVGFRALFMSDAGFQSEERPLAQGADLQATFLKIGHHGSAYSSSTAFIRALWVPKSASFR
jgi:beta-lactamase superfamily II metal-dependent hydrolase